MTYREARAWAVERLKRAGIENEVTESGYLMEYACGVDINYYLLNQTDEMPEKQTELYLEVVGRRCQHIPLQHLTGEQEFMGLPFRVNENILIPRQETEILVEEAICVLRNVLGSGRASTEADTELRAEAPRVLDLCTGSGCIAVSIKHFCPDTIVCASDISKGALQVAKENSRLNGTDVQFAESDLFSGLSGTFHMIISNPPYIPSFQIPTLMPEVRNHEPIGAFDGLADGLAFYRRITEESRRFLFPGGFLLFEIGEGQELAVPELMRRRGFTGIEVMPDLLGFDRVVKGRRGEYV